MTRLEKHTRTLKDGTQRVYRYAVGTDGERHSLGEGTVSTTCYRTTEKCRIVAALQANSSLLIVGEAGGGNTALSEFVVEELELLGFTVVTVKPSTAKQMVMAIALQLGVESESLEGKQLTAMQLMQAIAAPLRSVRASGELREQRLKNLFLERTPDPHAQTLTCIHPGNSIPKAV